MKLSKEQKLKIAEIETLLDTLHGLDKNIRKSLIINADQTKVVFLKETYLYLETTRDDN